MPDRTYALATWAPVLDLLFLGWACKRLGDWIRGWDAR